MTRGILTEWIKKSKRLSKTYISLEDLKTDCEKLFGTNFQLVVRGDLVMVYPFEILLDETLHFSKDTPVYLLKKGLLKKLNTKKLINELAKILAKKITVEKLMRDVLSSLTPSELNEVYERVIIKKGKIREEEGCYKLLIGGKRGYPFELAIRE